MTPRGLASLLALSLLTACVAPPPAPPAHPLPPPPSPDSAFDGSYDGVRTLTEAKTRRARCGKETNTAAIRVHNGVAILRLVPYRHPIVFHTKVKRDGTLRSTFKGNTLDGRFGPQGFDGTVETYSCVYSVHAERS